LTVGQNKWEYSHLIRRWQLQVYILWKCRIVLWLGCSIASQKEPCSIPYGNKL
jgi:hypothetical protein